MTIRLYGSKLGRRTYLSPYHNVRMLVWSNIIILPLFIPKEHERPYVYYLLRYDAQYNPARYIYNFIPMTAYD